MRGHRPWPKASPARVPHSAGNPMTFMDMPEATEVGSHQWGGIKFCYWLVKYADWKRWVISPDLKALSVGDVSMFRVVD